MKFLLILLLLNFSTYGHSNIDINIGYKVTLPVPMGSYDSGFTGRAYLMETNQLVPNFKVALSVESIEDKYTCSLNVFLGDVKVWSSGHFSQFFTTTKCVVELTEDGDLHLKGQEDRIGWRTGTSGQGVKRLSLLKTGNLVLVDALNVLKWQSFNFPTDIMVWGHKLDVETRLTSFITNSTSFYSFEIRRDKIALYLNSGKWKYSYWEFKPSKNRNITFAGLSTYGLEIFDDKYKKIAEIKSRKGPQPLRFLALENKTGNLGLYYFSPQKGKFEASFEVLNTICELPLACKPYGICTFSNSCSCMRLVKGGDGFSWDCKEGFYGEGKQVEMLELEGVSSVLKGENKRYINISQKDCADLCIDNCECVAALYSSVKDGDGDGECILYGEVVGVKQILRVRGMSYMVKVKKGNNNKSLGLKKWVIVVVGVGDGFIILIVLGGIFYYVIPKYLVETNT